MELGRRVAPANPHAGVQMARLLDLAGRGSEAILRLEQGCAEYPNYAQAWVLRASFSLNEKRAREAREFYERAISLDPTVKNEELLKRLRQAVGPRSADELMQPAPTRSA